MTGPEGEVEEEELTLHFVPLLGSVLALEEGSLKRKLTEAEIIDVRDRSVCIRMAKEHVEKLERERGLADIDAENVAAEWNRRRIEFTESYWPTLVLYVPTSGPGTRACREILENAKNDSEYEGLEFEAKQHDKGLARHLIDQMSLLPPKADKSELSDLARHLQYFVVRSKPFNSDQAMEVASCYLRLIGKLLAAGALTVSVESSNLTHSRGAWQDLLERFQETPLVSLLFGFVQMPAVYKNEYFSVGMHSLGRPDFVINKETLRGLEYPEDKLDQAAGELFQVLAYYLLDECPISQFRSGNTFSLSADSPQLRVNIEPASFFKESDIRSNPFGVWRLSANS